MRPQKAISYQFAPQQEAYVSWNGKKYWPQKNRLQLPYLPRPRRPWNHLSNPQNKKDYISFVYDVELDEKSNRLLFSGIEGTIRFFNLNDASTGILLRPPGNNYIWRLLLSPDREHICCVCTPSVEDRNKKPNRIQVWNYRILRTAVGLD
jgi:hypothetical protein